VELGEIVDRHEASFDVTVSGIQKTVTILTAVSVDDLVRVGLKTYVFAERSEGEYTSPFTRGIRDTLVRVRTPQRSS
jgi:hypothetical protein